jgi:hypothetical protein
MLLFKWLSGIKIQVEILVEGMSLNENETN